MQVMLVEDDLMLSSTLAKGLAEAGFIVSKCGTAEEAIRRAGLEPADLVVLDIGLPDASGLEVLRFLRSRGSHVPVIVLTARDSIRDRVSGLDAGADDYLVKPFAFDELLARIRVCLRRNPLPDAPVLQVDDLTIDVLNRQARRGTSVLDLTSQEFDLLRYLAVHAGKTVSRDMIARDVWRLQSRATPLDNVIDVHMSHLRMKVDKGFDRKLIQTIRGVGFILKAAS